MAYELDKYSIVSLETATLFDVATNKCLAIIDEIKDATLEGTAETIWSTGVQGRRLSSTKRNKTMAFSCNNGFIVGGVLQQQFGDENPVESYDSASILYPAFEYLTVTGGGTAANTEYEASGVTGNEIGWIYKVNKDRSQGQEYAQAAIVSNTEFSYDPTTREITLPLGVFADGDEIIVFYEYKTKGIQYTNKADSFAGDVKVVLDYLVKDVCTGAIRHSKFIADRGTIDDNFTLSFGNDMAVQPLKIELNSSLCSKDREYGRWIFPAE